MEERIRCRFESFGVDLEILMGNMFRMNVKFGHESEFYISELKLSNEFKLL